MSADRWIQAAPKIPAKAAQAQNTQAGDIIEPDMEMDVVPADEAIRKVHKKLRIAEQR